MLRAQPIKSIGLLRQILFCFLTLGMAFGSMAEDGRARAAGVERSSTASLEFSRGPSGNNTSGLNWLSETQNAKILRCNADKPAQSVDQRCYYRPNHNGMSQSERGNNLFYLGSSAVLPRGPKAVQADHWAHTVKTNAVFHSVSGVGPEKISTTGEPIVRGGVSAGVDRKKETDFLNVGQATERRFSKMESVSIAAQNLEVGDATGLKRPSLAFNLNRVSNGSPQMPFLDIMKTSRPWVGNSPGLWAAMSNEQLRASGALDASGWPKKIPDGLESLVASWADIGPMAKSGLKGVYVLTYEGEGNIKFKFDAKIISQKPGQIVFENESGKHMSMVITATDPQGDGQYIRNVSIVRQKYLDLHEAGEIFNPDWLSVIQDTSQLRFMDWMATNNSSLVEWSDRPEVGDETWATDGVPVEVMVQLANQTGADPWFTLPLHATEEYIRSFASYVRAHLDPKLKASFEMSNETWNWAFQQTHDIQAMMESDWGDPSDSGSHANYRAKLATEVALILRDVFDDEADTRLVNVLAVHPANPDMTDQELKADVWHRLEPKRWISPSSVFDAVAVTTYFGGKWLVDPGMRADLLNAVRDPSVDADSWLADKLMNSEYKGSIPRVADLLKAQKEVVSQYGLDLVAYEGGQHVHHKGPGKARDEIADLQGFLAKFVRSEQMARLYAELWGVWKAVGDGPFMQYVDVGKVSKYGSWGLLESLDDSNPRSEVLFDLNAKVQSWWEDGRAADVHTQGVIRLGSDGNDSLVGTTDDDFLVGGAGDDTFNGGAGDDAIHGGAGSDVLRLSGGLDEYRIVQEGDGHRLTGPDGSDYLVDVEEVMFSGDVRVGLGQIQSGTVQVPNGSGKNGGDTPTTQPD